ncbi:YdcH family protein [uncultured Maritimibacter sp.]|jgi:uncharacterized protein YdcH (DUF465 family)|uniref:YdcH family protein n=1 Tax=uncultured Maritimibacter sp. TaxID=991866 RepID=UPI000A9B3602|nr:YdcH family protein [uncultured Maritimibacter sp.]
MSNTPHELHEEFPDLIDQMKVLKSRDAHFARLFDEYHEVNRAVHRAETDVAPTDDFNATEMRKTRGALKDEIYKMLTAVHD